MSSSGFYVMGKHASVAWCIRREDAEHLCKWLNCRGNIHYTVEEASS